MKNIDKIASPRIYTAILFVALQLCVIGAKAQPEALSIGDTVPDISIANLINYKSDSARLSDLRGKLLILSFWSTSCAPCLAAFPKLDSLQKQFGDQIMILPVTTEEKNRIAAFWKNSRFTSKLSLPTAADDELLSRLFPHEGVPHEVWIDGNGVVKGITSAQYVDARNIQALLSGLSPDWAVNRWEADFDYRQSLIYLPRLEQQRDQIFYTAVIPHMPGLKSSDGFIKDSVRKLSRFYSINQTVIDLYRHAFQQDGFYYPLNRIVLKGGNRDSFFYNKSIDYREEWIKRNTWCYEAVLPFTVTEAEAHESMQKDLDRFFGHRVYKENHVVPCLVLKRINGFKPKKLVKQQAVTTQAGVSSYATIASLIKAIGFNLPNIPVIDETGIIETGPLQIPYSYLKDIDALNSALKFYGLELQKANRNMEQLVIDVSTG